MSNVVDIETAPFAIATVGMFGSAVVLQILPKGDMVPSSTLR